ncbi:MAG: hypothetical protein JKY23_00380 [Nitrospinaceae bacterium]|nr:hypothetical protein [Nitrospinaceae bacterium]
MIGADFTGMNPSDGGILSTPMGDNLLDAVFDQDLGEYTFPAMDGPALGTPLVLLSDPPSQDTMLVPQLREPNVNPFLGSPASIPPKSVPVCMPVETKVDHSVAQVWVNSPQDRVLRARLGYDIKARLRAGPDWSAMVCANAADEGVWATKIAVLKAVGVSTHCNVVLCAFYPDSLNVVVLCSEPFVPRMGRSPSPFASREDGERLFWHAMFPEEQLLREVCFLLSWTVLPILVGRRNQGGPQRTVDDLRRHTDYINVTTNTNLVSVPGWKQQIVTFTPSAGDPYSVPSAQGGWISGHKYVEVIVPRKYCPIPMKHLNMMRALTLCVMDIYTSYASLDKRVVADVSPVHQADLMPFLRDDQGTCLLVSPRLQRVAGTARSLVITEHGKKKTCTSRHREQGGYKKAHKKLPTQRQLVGMPSWGVPLRGMDMAVSHNHRVLHRVGDVWAGTQAWSAIVPFSNPGTLRYKRRPATVKSMSNTDVAPLLCEVADGQYTCMDAIAHHPERVRPVTDFHEVLSLFVKDEDITVSSVGSASASASSAASTPVCSKRKACALGEASTEMSNPVVYPVKAARTAVASSPSSPESSVREMLSKAHVTCEDYDLTSPPAGADLDLDRSIDDDKSEEEEDEDEDMSVASDSDVSRAPSPLPTRVPTLRRSPRRASVVIPDSDVEDSDDEEVSVAPRALRRSRRLRTCPASNTDEEITHVEDLDGDDDFVPDTPASPVEIQSDHESDCSYHSSQQEAQGSGYDSDSVSVAEAECVDDDDTVADDDEVVVVPLYKIPAGIRPITVTCAGRMDKRLCYIPIGTFDAFATNMRVALGLSPTSLCRFHINGRIVTEITFDELTRMQFTDLVPPDVVVTELCPELVPKCAALGAMSDMVSVVEELNIANTRVDEAQQTMFARLLSERKDREDYVNNCLDNVDTVINALVDREQQRIKENQQLRRKLYTERSVKRRLAFVPVKIDSESRKRIRLYTEEQGIDIDSDTDSDCE